MGYRADHPDALGYAGGTVAHACASWAALVRRSQPRGDGREARDLQPVARTSAPRSISRIDHLATQAPTPKQEIALPAGAPFGALTVNKDDAARCARRASAPARSRRCSIRRETPGAALHRAQLRAVRPVRRAPARRTRSRCAAAAARRAGEGGGDAERGRALQLRALRQALRHAADGREHARQARPAIRCSPGGALRACRCAATAASST